jgi:peptide/nickel transport system substrate-binding protein
MAVNFNRSTKLKLRRLIRRRKKVAQDFGQQAEDNLERNFFARLGRLVNVRRFVVGWVSLMILLMISVGVQVRSLNRFYQAVTPAPGGVFREGVIGSFTNANPLYAVTPVDSAVSRLVFSSLLEADANGRLVGDLAEDWQVDELGTTYTVNIRQNAKWHDGLPVTVDDVVFTYQSIQNADAKSPLFGSWQGVAVSKIDEQTVTFKLPSALASFPHSLTNGIVPRHLLEGVPKTQLRSIGFNTNPVGSGPFIWQSVEVSGGTQETRSESISLTRNDNYYRGAPLLDGYVLRTYRDEKRLLEAFDKLELQAASGVSQIPGNYEVDNAISVYSIPLSSIVGVFFNNSVDNLKEAKLRQGLVQATNPDEVVANLGYPLIRADSPLIRGQQGYNKELVQLPFDKDAANKKLDEAGWPLDAETGKRTKDGQQLRLRLVSQSLGEYSNVVKTLQDQWRAVGIEVEALLLPDEALQSQAIAQHDYDMLLYGISIGVDPDVFVYWHSSQAALNSTSRLNLSEYKNNVADRALEAGRSRSDPALREAKYKPFLEAWRNDAPAVSLYQPRFVYLVQGEISGFNVKLLNNASDRFYKVNEWMIRQERTNK